MAKIFEYRGVSDLVYAQVTADTAENFSTGTVKSLAGVAEISKSTDSSNEPHYYDNIPAVIVSSTGSDTITISASAIPYDVLADITGQYFDPTTGMYVEKERTPKYFALGYKTKTTDGEQMYVWRLKGSFNIPDETNSTENEGTDANGQEITFTGISTTHKFTKTLSPAKAVTVNATAGKADVSNFFDSVQTPDTVQAASADPSVSVIPSRASLVVDDKIQLQAVAVPADSAITWTSSNTSYAEVDSNGLVTAKGAGSATITAQITYDGTNYTDTCSVTVSAPSA